MPFVCINYSELLGGIQNYSIRNLIGFGKREKCLFSKELLLWDYRGIIFCNIFFSINNTIPFVSL